MRLKESRGGEGGLGRMVGRVYMYIDCREILANFDVYNISTMARNPLTDYDLHLDGFY